MVPRVLVSVWVLVLCAADLCNWTGSGSAAGPDSRLVLQVRLRCTEGSVTWLHPGPALRVVLEPNLSSARSGSVCVQPRPTLRGARLFVERSGRLQLLGEEEEEEEEEEGGRLGWHRAFCFRTDGPHRPVIYIQGWRGPGSWSRSWVGFRYELLDNSRGSAAPQEASCRPCSDSELLMAVCSSDFVVRGHIRNISHDPVRHTSVVEVAAARVYRQRSGAFELHPSASPPSWRGHIHIPLRCGVKPGDGAFLFTGSEHFGEAWLGCAPRYKDFLSAYHEARRERRNFCDFPLDR
ncbi:meteorin-like protein [Nematolebias whitei]|uniref:meteorin-like protein n=1 Tax=Nematolebias whitei TaxID=451745 RepID=UPI0018973AC3|nr:meteorin-like protein [Nematolebias whitei]